MRGRVYVAAAGALAVLAVGACSHDSASKSAVGLSVAGASGGGSSTGYGSVAGAGSVRAPAAAPVEGQAGHLSADAKSTELADTSAKIRIAYLRVAIKGAANVAVQADAADAIAEQAGGDVDGDDRTSGRHATASLVLRVPPAALQATLHKLSKLGRELGRQLSTTDVTQQVADVHARLVSANAALDRLRALYKNAHKVSDLIAIENELSARESDRESMLARQRALTHQTEKATINLTLVTASNHAVVHKPAKKRGGFLGGLQRGWDGFVAAAIWVASALGTLLPFVALVALLIVAARRWGWGAVRRRPTPAPATGPAPPD
ncbi:MAG TPA: DUF4349 domain-containing protein [Jatrophihabitantaceae bacterium]|nr:DUF4349 domain-containing protein [Jatrophihabitantaceae bacterium]